MTKMRKAEMTVVRFTESDVIVASSPVYTAYTFGFNNEIANDAYVKFQGGTYHDNASLTGALSSLGLNPNFQSHVEGSGTHSIYQTDFMYEMDSLASSTSTETSVLVPDGTYTYNYDVGAFVHNQ